MIDLKEKYYTCKYDRPFKEIMLKKENEEILKTLLEHILKLKISKIEINNIERNTGNINIKRKYLDAYLTTDKGKIGIEINSSNEPYVHPRNMAYLCDIYASHTLVGEIYDEDTNMIQINFSYGIKDTESIRKYKIQDDSKKEYVKNFIIYDINMEFYKKIWYSKNEKEINKNKYLIMLDLEKEELKELSGEDKVVCQYMEELNKLNTNPGFREYMSVEEDERKIHNSRMKAATEKGLKKGLEKGLQKGLEQGLEQGINQRNIEIARNLLKMNLSIDDIATATGLSKEEIENLK